MSAPFPFDFPQNTDSIQQLLYRIAALIQGGYAAGGGGDPATRSWSAYQQTVGGGSGFTSLKNVKSRQVYLNNISGKTLDISQDGTNFARLACSGDIGIGPSTMTIYPKENLAELLVRVHDGSAGNVTLDVFYFN